MYTIELPDTLAERLKNITLHDAQLIIGWQLKYLRTNPNALPHEIKEATYKAIQEDEIKIGKR